MQIRRTLAILGAGVLATGLMTLTPTPVGGQTACEEPYAPVAFTELYPAQEEAPDVPGDDVTVAPEAIEADTDGDGTADSLAGGQGDTATVTRGSGVIELTAAGASAVSVVGVADIDGDGRDELSVSVVGGADEGVFLVAGTIADGTVAVADAGVRLADEPGAATLQPGGGDRLLVSRGGFVDGRPSLDTHDATDVLALGPGGDASTIGPEASREGRLLTFVDTGANVLGLVIGVIAADGDLELLLIDVADEPGVEVRLTSAPEPSYGNASSPFGPLAVLEGSMGTFVRLTQSSGSGAAEYLWSLNDPCTPYPYDIDPTPTTDPSTSPPPTSPTAQPVAAEARFTG